MANPNPTMIYIDASRYSNTANKTGVEAYSFNVINELVKTHEKEITLISPHKIDLPVTQIIIPFPRLWTLLRLSWEVLRNKKIDNLFVPSHVLPLITPKNSTITIHDVVFKYSPKSYSQLSRLYLDWAAKFATKHASRIITPSDATKKDLVRFYKTDPKKITVIPLGFKPGSSDASESTLKTFNLRPHQYFLFLGRIEYKKNSDTLIEAFERFAKDNEEIKLVLAGFPGHGGQQIIDRIPTSLKKRVILTGYVQDDEKTALLQNALAFIFPSRFEGFGIPLLEAMDAGIPIIASDIPSSREVAGDAVCYFPKESSNALATLMSNMTKRRRLTPKQSAKYKATLRKHSWKTCAEAIWGLLLSKKLYEQKKIRQNKGG